MKLMIQEMKRVNMDSERAVPYLQMIDKYADEPTKKEIFKKIQDCKNVWDMEYVLVEFLMKIEYKGI